MNLLQLISECELRSGWNDTNYHVSWRSFLNEGVREFSRRYPWPGLEDFAQLTSDGTRFLILPHYVDTVISILNRSQNMPLERSGDFDREATFPQANRTAGTASAYDKIGVVPVLRDPTGLCYLRSTSASDTGAPSIYLTGYVSNSGASGTGMERTISTISVTPAGLSSVTVTTLFAQILSISKTTNTNGDFFIHDAGDSNRHISFLARYENEAAFKRVQLLYVPNAGTLFEVKFRHKVPPLTQNEQSPHPSVESDFIVHYALGAHYRHQQQFTKGQIQDAKAVQVLQDKAHKDQNFDEPWSQILPASAAYPRDWEYRG